MDVAKLFSDLESNSPALVDEAKKRFNELFASSKCDSTYYMRWEGTWVGSYNGRN